MNTNETQSPGSLHPVVRQSPRQRLETALGCIRNARVRLQIRCIFESEIPTASVFWDENERQVELIANDWEIIIRERDDTSHLPNSEIRRGDLSATINPQSESPAPASNG